MYAKALSWNPFFVFPIQFWFDLIKWDINGLVMQKKIIDPNVPPAKTSNVPTVVSNKIPARTDKKNVHGIVRTTEAVKRITNIMRDR